MNKADIEAIEAQHDADGLVPLGEEYTTGEVEIYEWAHSIWQREETLLAALKERDTRAAFDRSAAEHRLLIQIAELEAQNAALIAAIEAAPHEGHCTQRQWHAKHFSCDCWKAKALTEAQGDAESS